MNKKITLIWPTKEWQKFEDFINFVFDKGSETSEAILDEAYKLVFQTAKLNHK